MANADPNQTFLLSALDRNWSMPLFNVTSAGQVLDIELDSVPGWADSIDLECYFDLAVTLAAGGTAPSYSQFAPWNLFSDVQVSLGGGPFQRVSPYFYYLREKIMHPGWEPGQQGPVTYPYQSSVGWSTPSLTGTASSTVDNYLRFSIRIPLQVQYGSIYGLIPMGNAATKAKLRLTIAPSLYGTDAWLNPVVGGTNVTSVAIGSAQTSWVSPNINFKTTPATRTDVPNPQVGYVLNVQQRTTAFVGAGSLTPIKFPDPFKYLRLWHIIIDGTGAANSTGVTNFELDLTPGYPQFNYATPSAMQQYFNQTQRRYRQNLPTGVFCFDLVSGSSPDNPNGTQVIDGAAFQTLQTQVAVSSGTNVANPAKIVTFAEALSPVAF